MRRRGSSSATLRPRPPSVRRRVPVYEVPAELWLKIFTSARDQERHSDPKSKNNLSALKHVNRGVSVIKSLTLTCRHFSKLARPILFESVLLDGQKHGAEFVRFLTGDVQAKSCVRTLKLRSWSRDTDEEEEPKEPPRQKGILKGILRGRSIFAEMEELFIQFPSLREVHFLSSDLTEVMLQHVAHNLCSRHGDGTPKSPTRFNAEEEQVSVVTRLCFDTQTLQRSLPLLRSTDVTLPAVKSVSVTHSGSVGKLPPEEWMISLQSVIERAPDIDELKLPSWTRELDDEFEPLANDIRIPNLRVFQGPLAMAQIAMGLELRRLYVQEAGPRAGHLVPFSYFTPSLRSLCISNIAWRRDTPRDIARAFPQLEHLIVYAPRYWTSHTYVSDVDPMPKLRRMVLLDGAQADTMGVGDRGTAYTCSTLMVPADRVYDRRIDIEDKVVRDLEKVCPELREVRLHPRRMWERGPSGWLPVTLNYPSPTPTDSILMEYV
ncbi:hypothetical protein FRB90_008086 [Tulasnella sp. 427]|nr:hypothetical protein FRB90_008086 [Tulasnella sp. 427]